MGIWFIVVSGRAVPLAERVLRFRNMNPVSPPRLADPRTPYLRGIPPWKPHPCIHTQSSSPSLNHTPATPPPQSQIIPPLLPNPSPTPAPSCQLLIHQHPNQQREHTRTSLYVGSVELRSPFPPPRTTYLETGSTIRPYHRDPRCRRTSMTGFKRCQCRNQGFSALCPHGVSTAFCSG